MILILTSTGIINNNIKPNEVVSEQNCIDASNFLTNRFSGKTISVMITDMKEMINGLNNEIIEYENIFNILIDGLIDLTERNSKEFCRMEWIY